MTTCKRMKDIESRFDTQRDVPGLDEHAAVCAICREHLVFLQMTRALLQNQARAAKESRVDSERFLIDFRERVEAAPRGLNSRWAWLSAAAAACLVALSLLSIASRGPSAVDARSYVESAQTDLEGATTETYDTEDGTAVVWVNVPEGDMW